MTDNVRVVHVQTVNEGGGGTGSGNTNNSGSQVTTSQSSGLFHLIINFSSPNLSVQLSRNDQRKQSSYQNNTYSVSTLNRVVIKIFRIIQFS